MSEPDIVGEFLCSLFDLACGVKSKPFDVKGKGPKFEDETADRVYWMAREYGLDPHPPRMTLELPTLSGNLHQFDASFRWAQDYYVIECKNTRQDAKDYVYYFNAKIMDYLHSPYNDKLYMRGIFLSTVPVIDSAWKYGLAYGVRIIDPDSPPPEYLLKEPIDASLALIARNVLEKMDMLCEKCGEDAQKTLNEYRFLCSRWRDL